MSKSKNQNRLEGILGYVVPTPLPWAGASSAKCTFGSGWTADGWTPICVCRVLCICSVIVWSWLAVCPYFPGKVSPGGPCHLSSVIPLDQACWTSGDQGLSH